MSWKFLKRKVTLSIMTSKSVRTKIIVHSARRPYQKGSMYSVVIKIYATTQEIGSAMTTWRVKEFRFLTRLRTNSI